jgi:hypothetical protein
MWIQWGKKVLDVGSIEDFCETCKQERNYRVSLEYTVFGVYHIFNLLSEKRYYLQCPECGDVSPGDAAFLENHFPQIPIPALDRFGCLIFVVGFSLIVAGLTYLTMLRR